jgi:arylsulfatase A-like enzyme
LLFLSLHTVWLAPVAYSILFLIPAVLLAILTMALGKRISSAAGFFLFGLLGFGSLVLPYEQIHRAAGGLLALGAAAMLTRVLAPRTPAVVRFMRRSLAPLIAAVVVIGAGMTVGATWRERRAIGALPESPAGSPNVLLIMLDAVRAENLGAYGYDRRTTPSLDALAEEGAVFDWFITTSPWSLPALGTMLTGTYPHEQSSGFMERLDDRYPTVAEVLTAAGYASAGFSANLHYGSRDVGLSRGFIHYEDYVGPRESVLRHSWLGQTAIVQDILGVRSWSDLADIARDPDFTTAHRRECQKSAGEITRAFLDWLPAADGHPFFAFIIYYDAHFPYRAHEGFGEWLGQEPDPIDNYDSEIRYIDHYLGELTRELDSRGELDETVIIVTADHGELLGEHGLTTHGNSLYLQLLRVPLVVRFPKRVPAGVRVGRVAGMRHLPRTILDLAGVAGGEFPGRSLVDLMLDPEAASPDSFVLSEHTFDVGQISTVLDRPGELRSLISDELHYIRGLEGSEELYAYRRDPEESRTLVGVPEYEAALDRFRSALSEWFTVDEP